MEFQISKCGVINTLGPELRIGPTVLPSVSSYKYLGLPFEKSGCNWLKYTKETSDKFQRLTKGLFSARRAWDMATRTIILKTFLYSVVNYALPLVINWKERQLPPIKSKIDRHLKDNQDMALEFIFDKKPGKGVSRNLLLKLCYIIPLPLKQEIWKASLAHHLQSLTNENPLKKAQAKMPISVNQIIPICF